MMINEKDKQLIKSLIKEAETKSHSEIVPMIINHSDHYPAAHFRAAIIVSFIFSLALYFSPLSIINPIYYLWVQIPGLLIGYFLGQFPPITRLLITKKEIDAEVAQKGYEAFFTHNLHLTAKHTGVLILISLMEKRIKIIADAGIAKKVEQKVWDQIVYEFTENIHQGHFVDGLKKCIEATSNVLEYHFPTDGNAERSNELSNELIVEKHT